MATYNVDITSKAVKSFSNLDKRLVAAHCAFDTSIPANAIKVITHHLHNSTGNWLYVGGSEADGMNYRYIRIIIDIPAGSKTADEKQDLLRRISECCIDYEGKNAQGCEIWVRVNEVDQSNVIRVGGASNR